MREEGLRDWKIEEKLEREVRGVVEIEDIFGMVDGDGMVDGGEGELCIWSWEVVGSGAKVSGT